MKTLTASILLLLVTPVILQEEGKIEFRKEKVETTTGRICTCDFKFTFIIESGSCSVLSSSARCDKKCTGTVNKELGGPLGEELLFIVEMKIKKGKAKITDVGCFPPDEITGTGSGSEEPTGTGGGSEEPTGTGGGSEEPTGTGGGSEEYEDCFRKVKVNDLGKKCTCDFCFKYKVIPVFPPNCEIVSATATCHKTCNGAVKNFVVQGPSSPDSYTVDMKVKRGQVLDLTVTSHNIEVCKPVGPTSPGSGSEEPTGTEGGMGGHCPRGFVQVCPPVDGVCPSDSAEVCPADNVAVGTESRMGMMGPGDDSCECVPLVLMQMVMAQEVAERAKATSRQEIVFPFVVNVTASNVPVTLDGNHQMCLCNFTFNCTETIWPFYIPNITLNPTPIPNGLLMAHCIVFSLPPTTVPCNGTKNGTFNAPADTPLGVSFNITDMTVTNGAVTIPKGGVVVINPLAPPEGIDNGCVCVSA